MLEAVCDLLADAGPGTSLPAHPATPEWGRIVQAVEDHLRAEPRPGVQHRRTQHCARPAASPACGPPSRATFSVAPERYLRLRRLALARTALRSAEPGKLSLAQVAATHGWDIASFIRDDREVFAADPLFALPDAD